PAFWRSSPATSSVRRAFWPVWALIQWCVPSGSRSFPVAVVPVSTRAGHPLGFVERSKPAGVAFKAVSRRVAAGGRRSRHARPAPYWFANLACAPLSPRTLKPPLSRRFCWTAPEGTTGTGPVRAFGAEKEHSHDQDHQHHPLFLQGRSI